MTNFISCRVIKIKTGQDASNLTKHGMRQQGYDGKSKIDRSRTPLNEHHTYCNDSGQWTQEANCPNYHALLKARCSAQGAKRPKNGVFGTEMLMTASPEIFHDERGQICNDKAKRWAEDCRKVAEKEYGGMIVASRLDLDETTPHISFFILPTYEKKYGGEKRKSKRERATKTSVSHNRVFGGKEQYSQLQDWLADGLKDRGWNVQRGIPVELTRAMNMRPDGQAFHKLKEIEKVCQKRLEALNAREKIVFNFLANFLDKTHKFLPNKYKQQLTELVLRLKRGIAPLPDVEKHLLNNLTKQRESPKNLGPSGYEPDAPKPKM